MYCFFIKVKYSFNIFSNLNFIKLGEYKRMNCDKVPPESRDDTVMFCDDSPSLDASMNARGLRKATNS